MNSLDLTRVSPIRFPARPAETVRRGDWEIVLAYEDEGDGPWLVDLSHRTRWDIQNRDLDALHPFESDIPATPGRCALSRGWLINRMNRTQAALWDLASEGETAPPADYLATETTDSLCLLALAGKNILAVMEKLTPLDVAAPDRTPPYLIQGPVLRIPTQVVVFNAAILLAFSRGYAQSFADAVLSAGKVEALRPGGENKWKEAGRLLFT